MSKIINIVSEIREYITNYRKLLSLLSVPASWNKLLSSLDTIEDNEEAIESFLKIDWPYDDGNKYLLIYGILQALFLQQEAVKHLYESLNDSYLRDSFLWKIREIRNAATGHPTERTGREESNFLARMTINKNGFMLMTTYADGRPPSFQNVNIPIIIEGQRTIIEHDIIHVLEKLKQEEREYREMFKAEKLKDIFHPTMGYYFQKINESIHAARPNKSGEGYVDLIIDVIDKYKKALEERNIINIYNSVNELFYPLLELKKYFQNPIESKLNEKDAYIFTFFVEKNLKYQKENAIEIDEQNETEI